MPGMAHMQSPGSMLSFLWLWVAMSAAMMLPSSVLAASLAVRLGQSASAFVTGYFAVWCTTGVVAFEAARVFATGDRWVAAGACLVAAAYQVSPLKEAFLRRCRGPLGPLLRRRAFGAGVEHGLVCMGCCWALMLVLLTFGMGSLLWMGALAAAIFVEKVTPIGGRASTPVALGLLGAAMWVAL